MSQNDRNHKIPPKVLNHIRTDIRCDETTENYTNREILTPLSSIFQTFPEIPNITEDILNSSWKYIQSYYQYSQLFAKIFPYQLFFQIISDNPNNNVKFLAMKHISFFSQFDSFPFQDFDNFAIINFIKINRPYFIFIHQFNEISSRIPRSIYFPRHFIPTLKQIALISNSNVFRNAAFN